MSDTLIEAAGLSAGYGKMAVVRDLDLQVGAGEVVALIGPNGAGKTTTLRILTTLLEPSSGSAVVAAAYERTSSSASANVPAVLRSSPVIDSPVAVACT